MFATTTRADWGILSPLARALAARSDCAVTVMASNMHLDTSRGNTIDEIRADGFDPIIAPMPTGFETGRDAAMAAGALQTSAAKVIDQVKPDAIVLLGDRFEMLSIAAAATIMRVPIVHISGGEITAGAFDDSFRHAITKLSYLHLTATETYRRRVIQLGETPDRVINTGALGLYQGELMTRTQLEENLNWTFGPNAMLVTVHPETLGEPIINQTLEALDQFPESRLLITYPNNDPQGQQIIRAIEAYATRWGSRVKIIPSLGKKRYHSALRCVRAVVGNSSSGIVEVPSAGIPTVDIGNRQLGRIAADSVIHTPAHKNQIVKAITKALTLNCHGIPNPYHRPDTLQLMVRAITETPLNGIKTFHDLP